MPDTIKDGTGSGNLAMVDGNNRLTTASNSQTEEHYISSSEGLAYFAHTGDTADTLTLTATGGPMLYIKNDNASKQLIISKILASSDTAGNIVTFVSNPVLSTIGNNNIHTPAPLNFGKPIPATGTFYSWNEVGDGMTGFTGGTLVKPFILGSGIQVFPIESAFVLERGDSFMITARGSGEFEVGIRCFFMDAEV